MLSREISEFHGFIRYVSVSYGLKSTSVIFCVFQYEKVL